jgi:outer membrane protein assembly factor BamB
MKSESRLPVSILGPTPVSRVLFAADGLVWVEQQYDSVDRPGDSRWFAFNSRGQGGLTPAKSFPNLAPQSRIVVRGWGAGGIDGWSLRQVQFEYKNCEPGELSGIHTTERSENLRWKLAIDGSCVAQNVNDHGELIVATDTAMLYGVDPRGRMRWSHKAACRTDWIVAVGRDSAAYLCGRDLHRTGADGKRWKLTLDGDVDREFVKVDAAESLYLLTQDGNLLLAIDKSGKLLWRHPVAAGQILGLDKAGRLYVRSGGTLACLSD